MNDELSQAKSILLNSCQNMERLGRSTFWPYESTFSQVKQSLDPMWQQRQELFHRLNSLFPKMNIGATSIFKANDHFRKIIKDMATASPSGKLLADFSRPHASWRKNILSMEDQLTQLRATSQLSIGNVACRLAVTERIIAGMWAKTQRSTLDRPSQVLRDSMAQMTDGYASLATSIHNYADIIRLPDITVPGATRELFMAAHALEQRFPPENLDKETEECKVQMVAAYEQETSECLSLLQSFDPALEKLYLGARQALDDSNPDRVRHFLVSLRELCNHVLHRLAPDSDVMAWIPSDAKDLLHEGRPTRRARVLYIFRDLNHPPLADFVDSDTTEQLQLFKSFNRIHELDPTITETLLRTVLWRTESWLTYILQLREI